MKTTILAFLTLAALPLCSCTPRQNSKNLVFATFTKTGLDISATGGTPTSAMFGYKRFEGAIIPVDPETSTGAETDAHSVFAAMELNNDWLSGLDILQVFATGDAAVRAASEPESLLKGLTNAGGNTDS